MDFEFSPSDLQFQHDLRDLLTELVPDWYRGRYNEDDASFDVTLRVTAEMARRGWLTMHWSSADGGQDASIWQQVIMREETRRRFEPRGSQYMSVNWVGPSILMYGTPEQKSQHLGAIAAGRSFWAQGFSEPDAGSDLASLKIAARRDGDEYLVNGEKIWTSHTQRAEWLFLLARTDASAPKHRGISVFLVPLDTPGVTIVPIESVVGYGEFAHVFFEDVRLPKSALLGEENQGWDVTINALKFERLGAPRYIEALGQLEILLEYAKTTRDGGAPLWDDPLVQHRFAELWSDADSAKLLYYQATSLMDEGEDINLIGSLARFAQTTVVQKVASFALELIGDDAELRGDDESPYNGWWPEIWLHAISATIAAGTTEIQKNTVATRGLGLPR